MALACLRPGYNIYSCVVRHIISAYEGPGSPKFTELSNQITVELKDVKIDTAPISAYLMYLEEKLKGGSLVARIEAEVTTPLVVHVRNPYMPLEIGLAWHPYFNAPYIPATTIKGALRAYSPPQICGRPAAEVFGTVGDQGALIVTDALPITPDVLGADVITPHYKEPDQVEEHKVRPIPIVFPVVKPGARFAFHIASTELEQRCLSEIWPAIDRAFAKGIGAKTKIGYSRLKKL